MATPVGTGDVAAPAGQVAGQVADGAFRHDDLDIDDGFQHDGLGVAHRLDDRLTGGDGEGDLLAIDGVRLAVMDGDLDVLDLVTGDHAAFQALPDGAAKAALAQRLMEESGVRLIPTLNAGSEGLREMADEAERFGAVIGGDLAAASVALNDNLTRLDVQLAAAGQQIGGQLIPVLAVVTDEMVAFNEQSAIAARFGEGLNKVLTGTVVSVTTIAEKIGLFGDALGATAAQIAAILRGDFDQVAVIAEDFKHNMDASALALSDFHFNLIAASEGVTEAGTEAAAAAPKLRQFDAALLATASSSKQAGDSYAIMRRLMSGLDKDLASVSKFLAEVTRNQVEGERAAQDQLERLEELVAARRGENEEIGLSESSLAALVEQRTLAAAAQKEETAAALDAIEPGNRLADIYRQQAAALRELAAVQREGDVKAATVEAAETARQAWEDISSDVAESLTDAILQGGDAWETLVRQIEATVIRATIAPVVQGGVNALLQSVGLGPGAGLGTGAFGAIGSAGSTVFGGSGTDLTRQLITGQMGVGNAAGTAFANATGTGLDGLLATNGAYGTAGLSALQGLGYAGLFLAATTWFANLGSGIDRFGAAVETTLTGAGDTISRLLDATNDTTGVIEQRWDEAFRTDEQQAAHLERIFFSPDTERPAAIGNRITELDPVLESINGSVVDATSRLVEQLFGQDSPAFSVLSSFVARGGDDSTGRIFARGAGGEDLLSFNADFKAGQAGFEQFADNFDRVILAVLGSLDGLDDSLSAIVGSVDPATAAIEDVQAALAILGEFQTALDAADAFGDIDTALAAVSRAGLDASSQFDRMRQDLIGAANAGAIGTAEILAGMQQVQGGFVQMLASIDQASQSIAERTEANIRNVQLAVLDDAGKYDFLDAEITRQLDTLKTLTDPALISDYTNRIQGNLNAAFGMLDGGEQGRLSDEFIARFQQVGDIAQQQLEAGQELAIAGQREFVSEMKTAIRTEFGAVAQQMAAAAQSIANTRIGIDANVNVNVPATVEVGFAGPTSDGG